LLKIKIRKNVSDGCVIHAPGLKHKVREFKKDYPDSEVIWMYREPKECVASMKKLHNWEEYTKQELKNMKPILDEYEINSHAETFMKLVISTRTLGEVYFEQGYISQLVNMKAIEHYPGFKKDNNNKMKKKLIDKIKCFFGLHKWKYANKEGTLRCCDNCNRMARSKL